MKNYIFIALVIFALSSCSKNKISNSPNQFAGPDLYSSMSAQERSLLGTWYFAYDIFERENTPDSMSTQSLINYGSTQETDTLRFYSTQFVGFEDYCPLVAPQNLRSKLKTANMFTAYLLNCFPDYITGWYIENNTLNNYWGDSTASMPVEQFPIITINSDSLVFRYEGNSNPSNIISRKTVFYKK